MRFVLRITVLVILWSCLVPSGFSQELSRRLILKDGSYQMVTKWEVQGQRVRYLSAERGEWEELPSSLVDWDATNKFQDERTAGAPAREAVEIDRELAAEEAAEDVKRPEVAPHLRLPADAAILLFDTFQSQPQLVELQQNGGEIDRNTKANILRAAINPIASSKQTIELESAHASVQSHIASTAIFINLAEKSDDIAGPQKPEQPQKPQQPIPEWDRFRIVRAQVKGNKRIVGNIKINPLGKSSQHEALIATTSQKLSGDWVKITPTQPLDPGEYAVVELLGSSGINLFVWDFGVNPAAPANHQPITPEIPAPSQPSPQMQKEMKPRP